MAIGLVVASLSIASGALVGVTLGLIGGGGSVLAVPLLIYLVGVPSPHVAIGTAAIAVALNAALGLAAHARQGTVKWPCAVVFSLAGILGALLGAAAGKALSGPVLLALFGVAMIGVGLSMLRGQQLDDPKDIRLTPQSASHLLPRLIGVGGGVGLLSGFFGIGGGVLIVPGLVLGMDMALASAIGTSLFAVTAFGLTTAGSYAFSGLVDWPLALLVIAGGIAGIAIGTIANARLKSHKRVLAGIFASVVIAVGLYVSARGILAFFALA